ncbi:ABC transporter permease [Jidongwangia harbinensis]|uniref:ABC transporter permease n=1 Tax=Jidongwangia harbinensis TaxID=2878561 RepID=UPI001CD9D21A|nr:ABC transporter permease [Jidongwangia harbinensis]MCA2214916.1 ABC transporter permease [Jidongwangia harbinensis]
MSVTPPHRRGTRSRLLAELAMGVRLSVAGGRSGWARLAMIAAGVGLGVTMLLLAATVPALVAARDTRLVARAIDNQSEIPRGDDTMLIADANSLYGERTIHGRLVQREGDRAPLPPGADRIPAPGEMVVSPALAEHLATGEGALLAERWNGRIVGTLGPEGVLNPQEFVFYLGVDSLTDETAHRIRSFGSSRAVDEGIAAPLLLLGLVGLVALLLPVAVFLATAVRFGGEARDRQLAALRLVGADAAMTRRIAAGETLAGAVLGLLTGALLFAVVGLLASRLVPPGMSFYRADLRPVPMLAAIVAVVVPVGAVLVTVSALRRVVLEPLGVVRHSTARRRRLWWRLILPVVGIGLLFTVRSGPDASGGEGFAYVAMAGMAALLIGVALLLPWLVDAAVRRLDGGGVAWQLAVRRLQLDSGTAVRAVSGIAVSVAGAIALQGVLSAVQGQYSAEGGTDPAGNYQAMVLPSAGAAARWTEGLANAPGVRTAGVLSRVTATPTPAPADGYTHAVEVADCTLLRLRATIGDCADGDVFILVPQTDGAAGGAAVTPGTTYTLGEPGSGRTVAWTLPGNAPTVPGRGTGLEAAYGPTVLATPAAVRDARPTLAADRVYVGLDTGDPAAIERLRNAAARIDPTAMIRTLPDRTFASVLSTIREAVLVGAAALLLLVGASMLVNVIEQLRERRRLLAILVAFGTRRGTLGGSVLYQIAVPVLLGLGLAVVVGTGLGAVLQAAAGAPIRLDWLGIGATSGAAALVVLLTTAASLPLLWRLTKPGGLRSE